jgi:hypothetical protein
VRRDWDAGPAAHRAATLMEASCGDKHRVLKGYALFAARIWLLGMLVLCSGCDSFVNARIKVVSSYEIPHRRCAESTSGAGMNRPLGRCVANASTPLAADDRREVDQKPQRVCRSRRVTLLGVVCPTRNGSPNPTDIRSS